MKCFLIVIPYFSINSTSSMENMNAETLVVVHIKYYFEYVMYSLFDFNIHWLGNRILLFPIYQHQIDSDTIRVCVFECLRDSLNNEWP